MLTALIAAGVVPGMGFAQQNAAAPADDPNGPATVSAEEMTGRPDREVFLERDVEIIRGPTTVTSDRATYRVLEDEVEASGNIRLRRNADSYTGDDMRLKIDTGEGFITHPTYHLGKNNAQGRADRVDFESREEATITDSSYSTCEGPDPDWYLKSGIMKLDTGRDVGTAYRSLVYFKGVPILGAPAISFPLSDARKSGLLPPTIGSNSKGGLDITTPYYLNIAPNRDLTLYPRLIARRGLQLGAEARYLGETYNGITRAEYLPHDRLTNSDRYLLSSLHNQTLAPGLFANWNLNFASDDNYMSDFTRNLTNTTQRLLARDINLNYAGSFWSSTARLSNYQVLQDPAAPITKPYARLPQLTFLSGQQDVNGFDWNADAELTRFWHADLVRGNRMVINPRLAYPIINQAFFVIPKVQVHATRYQLENTAPGASTTLSRTVPIFSVDSGMVFERDARFFNLPTTQTLEPRLFYVYAPYRDQSAFPLFDTAEADLSFGQLFSENRFIGNDRISNSNQLTAALVSRFLEPSGALRARFAIGQRYYFTDQRVSLTSTATESRSDLLLSAYTQLSRSLSFEGNTQYSQSLHKLRRASLFGQWQPEPGKVLNLRYRRDLPNNLEQVEVSGQWPISRRWYGVARVNYSLPDKRIAESLGGIEYKADCWVFRLVGQRIPTATQQSTSAIYFQLELTGLTRLGSNPLDALRAAVPGYQMVNQPRPNP
ncbi:LPS-assembly protein LptD [Noviherbaspirillum humi]|uniref:LPS-assembly protein LptD n=1 Tax=Noviherbaspirillum humi TaxID=1688639 RepID=UPI001FE45B6D|nr:LPS-assembly protein LptD [Noviherbaspirillum humi]